MLRAATHEEIYGPQCQIERAGLGMLIVEFITSLLALGIAGWTWKGENQRWREIMEMKRMRNRHFDEDDEGDGNGWD